MSENENNQYRLLSPWAYVGYGLLFTLPVIGWILAIVFARGYWCMVLVVVILSIVGMVMGVSIMDGLSSYQYNYRY